MSEENVGLDLSEMLRRLMEAREKRDTTKTAAERAERQYRTLEAEVWEALEDSPIEGTIKIDLGPPYGLVSFLPRETYFGRVIDKEDALDYFEQRAMSEEMTEPKIAKARVNELVREHLEQKKPMPPGLDFYPKRYVSISRKQNS